jgi:hypothetical protein
MKLCGQIISVSVVANLRVEKPRIRISIPGCGERSFSSPKLLDRGQSRFMFIGCRGTFPRRKSSWLLSWSLISIHLNTELRITDLLLCPPTCFMACAWQLYFLSVKVIAWLSVIFLFTIYPTFTKRGYTPTRRLKSRNGTYCPFLTFSKQRTLFLFLLFHQRIHINWNTFFQITMLKLCDVF